jgi:mono/diheme cytochrome c family protein
VTVDRTPAPHAPAARRRPRASLAAFTVLAAGGIGMAACGESDPYKDGAAGGGSELAVGEQTYRDFCGSCHGRDFEGSSNGPSHLDAVYAPESTTDEDFRAAITQGAPEANYDLGSMPAIASLDDREIADVIAYIRSVQDERGFND